MMAASNGIQLEAGRRGADFLEYRRWARKRCAGPWRESDVVRRGKEQPVKRGPNRDPVLASVTTNDSNLTNDRSLLVAAVVVSM